ncbi:MOSC domain-containing protein [Inquilinus sp. NPDC058860]|uniref:MOSC domain-containing protein n=1 Tax=Inquilinus sp. NPDC058860 TaxID=3346652 RepID=UPI00369D6F1A
MTAARLADLYRYPVKGLAGQKLAATDLAAGETLPHDRRFAIVHGASQCDPTAPSWQPKRQFLQLMTDERLAQLGVDYDDATEALTLKRDGKQVARGLLSLPIGQELINQFLNAFMKDPRGALKIVSAPGIAFTDKPEKLVSLINLASAKDIERVTRAPVDPRRFRGNLYLDGLPAWSEFELVGKELAVGPVRLRVVSRIGRCAATNVNPATGDRDLNIPKALITGFGHADCGIYAEVLVGGRIAEGDTLAIA